MGMPDTAGRGTRDAGGWTREAVLALPDDGQRRELLDGELIVTPAPRPLHQIALHRLERALDTVLASGPLRVLRSPADLSLGEEEILQPDLFVYRRSAGRPLRDWSQITELALVIEVLSPSTARYDRGLKRRRYQRARVPEYWIVDLDGQLIERWRPDDDRPEIIIQQLRWESGEGAALELELDVERFFREVHEE